MAGDPREVESDHGGRMSSGSRRISTDRGCARGSESVSHGLLWFVAWNLEVLVFEMAGIG